MRSWITESKKAMSAEMGSAISGVKEHDQQVQMRDGSNIACRVYQPETPPSGGSALAIIFHGGGWCIGGLENEELLCRLLTSRLGMVSVNVDYRLAPEHKFPVAVHDCHDATKWVCMISRGFVRKHLANSALGSSERLLSQRRSEQRLRRRRNLGRGQPHISNRSSLPRREDVTTNYWLFTHDSSALLSQIYPR